VRSTLRLSPDSFRLALIRLEADDLLPLAPCHASVICSPRWLIEKNREEEAQAVIIRLHGENAFSGAEFNEMRENIVWERDNSIRSVSVLFSTPAMRRRVLAAFGVQAFGQFTGINGSFSLFLSSPSS
jgi:hypothetical protein